MRKYWYIVASLVLLSLLAAAACAPSGMASSAPSITITSPANGSTVPAGSVTVTAQVSNFQLVDQLGKPNVAGEGHIHYYIDVQPPTTPNKPATTAPGTFAPTSATSYTWKDVAPGTHTFSVQLANNDHSPLIPIVTATVTVTVK